MSELGASSGSTAVAERPISQDSGAHSRSQAQGIPQQSGAEERGLAERIFQASDPDTALRELAQASPDVPKPAEVGKVQSNKGSPETTPQRPDQQEGIGQSNHDRTRISIPEAEVPVSLKGIVEFLQDQKFDPERQFYEFEVTPEVNPIRAEDVRALVQLPYEVSLGELSGKIIIRTGMSGRIGKPRESGNILDRSSSRLSMHTHPPKALGEPDMVVPSFPDLDLADLGKGNAPLVLAHTNGMMVYRAPVVNPLTGESASDEMRELFLLYSNAKGVDIFNLGSGRNISDMPKEEQVRLLREFIDDSQAVVDEAKWEDTEGIERIMKIVNLKK